MAHSTSYKLPLLQDNIFQVRLATMTTAGIIALLMTAISPLLTTCLLCFLGVQLLLSAENWRRWANVDQPQTDITLDQSIKMLIGASALLFATFIVQLHVVSQMVILTTAALSLTAYFIYPCIKNSQTALNTALWQATMALDIRKIEILLHRGADPYYPDEMGNNAFHLAIQDHENAAIVLATLKGKPAPSTFSQIGDDSKLLLDNEIKSHWSKIGETSQVWIADRTQNNFYPILQAFKNLMAAYQPRLHKMLNTLISFLRGEMSMPCNCFYKNNAGCTPQDLINLNVKDEHNTHLLQAFFLPEAYQEPDQPNIFQPSQVPVASENIEPQPTEHCEPSTDAYSVGKPTKKK